MRYFPVILILILTGCPKPKKPFDFFLGTLSPSGDFSAGPNNLAVPTDVTAYGADQKCEIHWIADSSANFHVVAYSTESGFVPDSISPNFEGSFSDSVIVSSLSNDTPYYFRVKSINNPDPEHYDQSLFSDEVSCTPNASSSAFPPHLKSVTAGDETNEILFDVDALFSNYHILYWSNSPGVSTSSNKIEGVTNPYLHTNLSNGVTYYYRLSTHDYFSRESVLGREMSATPRIAPPSAPTGLAAQPIEGGLRISWSAAAKASSYNLYWSYSPGVTTSSNKVANVTSAYDLTGLTMAQAVYYRIESVNTTGTALSDESSKMTVQMRKVPAAVALDVSGTTGDRYSTFDYSDDGYTIVVNQYKGTNDGVNGSPVLYAVQTLTFNRTYDRVSTISYDVASGTTEDRFVTFQYADASSRPSLVKIYKGGLNDSATLIEIREYRYNGSGSPTCTRTADGSDVTNDLWTYAYGASSNELNGYKAGSCASPSSHWFISTSYLDLSNRTVCSQSSVLSGSIWYDSVFTFSDFDSFNNSINRTLSSTGTCESPGTTIATYTNTYEYSGSLLVCQSSVPSPNVQKWTLSDGFFTEYLYYSSGSCSAPGTLTQKFSLTSKTDAITNPYLFLSTGMTPNANGNVTERYSNFLRGSGYSGYGAPGFLAP